MIRSLAALLVVASCLVLPAVGRAEAAESESEFVDPRWRYIAEVATGVSLVNDVSSTNGTSRNEGVGALHLKANFLAPVAENRGAGGGLSFDSHGRTSLLGEYRLLQDFPDAPVVTWLSAGPVLDVWPYFGLGAKVGVGGGLEVSPGWRCSVEAGLLATVVHIRVGFDIAISAAYLF